MHADPHTLKDIFLREEQFEIPVFQRPYAWNREQNWEPLWLDIQALAEKAVRGEHVRSHFLGALVLDMVSTPTGRLPRRWVIDGQQRLTTVQFLLAAFALVCLDTELHDEHQALMKLLRNVDVSVKTEDEQFKVWPTGADREHFRRVMTASSVSDLLASYDVTRGRHTDNRVADAFIFFYDTITQWLSAEPADIALRAEALRNVIRDHLRIVTIDLTSEDDGQLIFETLNARSQPLLPIDLVKNLLFRTARDEELDIDTLYDKYWRGFDAASNFWRRKVGRGHARRPRADTFLFHYLIARRRQEGRSDRIYPEFRDFVASGSGDTTDHFEKLFTYSVAYRELIEANVTSAEADALRAVNTLGHTTVYPLLLELRVLHEGSPEIVGAIAKDIESFLVRRTVCRLQPRGYGVFFAGLVSALHDSDPVGSVRQKLLAGTAVATRWPNDEEFKTDWMIKPLDGSIAHVLLYGIERDMHGPKSETISIESKLTLEHLMPQKWETHWPLPQTANVDEARQLREQMIRCIGNLTLLTGRLNPSIGNGSWTKKRPEIRKHSLLMLNKEIEAEGTWDETKILARATRLFDIAVKRWSRPGATD